MGSITSLSGRSASHGSGERDGSPVMADDPLETIDEHTRQLLGRRTGARRDRVWMLAGQLAGLRRGDARTPLRAIRDDVRAALPLLTLAALQYNKCHSGRGGPSGPQSKRSNLVACRTGFFGAIVKIGNRMY